MTIQPRTVVAQRDGPDLVLDSAAIHALLGHRYPFLLVDRIVIVEAGRRVVGTKRISSGEWWCEGHDAGSIQFPFSLVIEAMAQTAGAIIRDLIDGAEGAVPYFMGANHIRLRQVARPGDEITMTLTMRQWRRGVCKTHGVATVDGRLVASADLTTVIRAARPLPDEHD
jgi:3-hydroxyacyl-[acyl-carrier-protein] dehydratase